MTPQSALPGEGDCQVRLSNRIHGGADERDIECELGMELCADVDVGGQHFGKTGYKQNVVEGHCVPGEHGVGKGEACSGQNVSVLARIFRVGS